MKKLIDNNINNKTPLFSGVFVLTEQLTNY
jgi:hypothetical protein